MKNPFTVKKFFLTEGIENYKIFIQRPNPMKSLKFVYLVLLLFDKLN